MLESALFRRSKRCGMLLQYVVEETLEGRSENLKERAIGISVFGRKPTYDTNEDPIVRTTAVEVRKRIAQYYHETGHDSAVQIELTSGSYVPQFYAPAATRTPRPLVKVEEPRHRSTRTLVVTAIIVTAAVLAALAIVWARGASESRSPLDAFWAPLSRSDTVILAMGDISEVPNTSDGRTFSQTSQGDRVGFAD